MIQSKLIVGPNTQKTTERAIKLIFKYLKKEPFAHPDFLLIEGENSISIDQIRKIKKWLTLKPYHGKTKAVLIKEAEKLTLPAQNAFLKTLEEPPSQSLIILTTGRPENLLPTIISRCQIIRIGGIIKTENKSFDFKKIQKMRIGEKLILATNLGEDKKRCEFFIKQLLFYLAKSLLEKPSLNLVKNIKITIYTLWLIKQNVNPVLATGNLLLRLI